MSHFYKSNSKDLPIKYRFSALASSTAPDSSTTGSASQGVDGLADWFGELGTRIWATNNTSKTKQENETQRNKEKGKQVWQKMNNYDYETNRCQAVWRTWVFTGSQGGNSTHGVIAPGAWTHHLSASKRTWTGEKKQTFSCLDVSE